MSNEENAISSMSLIRKLIAITSEIGSLEKKGKADMGRGGKYDYVKGEMAMADFRPFEVKYGIKVLTEVAEDTVTTVQKEGAGFLTTGVIRYHIYDADSDKVLTASVLASGYDSTDKGSYKAMTGAFKYFVLQEFSASTDDPEKDNGVEPVSKKGFSSNKSKMAAKTKSSGGFTQKTTTTVAAVTKEETTEEEAAPTTSASFKPAASTKFSVPGKTGIMTKDSENTAEKATAFKEAANSDTTPKFKQSKFADKF